MTKKQKKTLIRISIGAVFYILAIVFPTDRLGLGDYEKLFGLGLMLIQMCIRDRSTWIPGELWITKGGWSWC